MKLRNGKYTSKEDLLNLLEEQKDLSKEQNEIFKQIDINDLLVSPVNELMLEFILVCILLIYLVTIFYIMFVC